MNFTYTNLSMIIAVKGAGLLEAAGFTGIPLMLFFILLCKRYLKYSRIV